MSLADRIRNAWDAFLNRDPPPYKDLGPAYSLRPDRPRFTGGNERSILSSIYTRIAIDCASVEIMHVQLDDNQRYSETISSGLNRCLTFEANMDQTGRSFIQDVVQSMLDEGVVCIVPIDADIRRGTYEKLPYMDISSMRTARIVEWYPAHVRIEVYNEKTGNKQEVTVAKNRVAIIENPLYEVMNEPNSTLQRLKHKLNLLDVIDEQSSSGKLNLVVQLPYQVKSELRKQEAKQRLADIQEQLIGSKYGIAYTDGTEKIVQLNRPIDNNLMGQVEYLTNTLYGQLGMTASIMDGTADEKTMLNYNNRTIEPILSAIVNELRRKFLSEEGISRGESIEFFRDPFRLVPVEQIAQIADTFTRNEIMTSNEIRQIVGMKPARDPNADELRNKNLSQPAEIQELIRENRRKIQNEEQPDGGLQGLRDPE